VADYPTPFDTARDQEWRDLERRLQGLAGQVRFPPTPDLAGATRRRLADHDARPALPAPERRTGWWPRLAIAAAVLILFAAGLLAVSAPARDAVARWIDIPGIRVMFDDDSRADPESTVRSWLGTPTPLEAITR
jgi:hypothetical protein